MDFAKLMKQPQVAEIALDTYAINEYGLDALFLLVGSEKALLIDTGTGVFDLPALVKGLTDKPLIVALTHGHVDHAGGIGFFDEVYAHPDDFDMALNIPYEQRKGYASGILANNPYSPIDAESVVNHAKMPKMLPLFEGEVIDLGGRKVAVYETPGHTPGGLSFLDVRERILFSGDACNMNTLLMSFGGEPHPKQTLTTLKATAAKLKGLEPYYDRNYNGHIGYGGMPTCLPQPYSVNADMLGLVDDILSGKEQAEEQPFSIGGQPRPSAYYAKRGAAGVRFTESTKK